MSALRVLLVDDNFVVRRGLRNLLECESDIAVVGEASTGAEAVRRAPELGADLVLMDVRMPDGDGISATAEVLKLDPETRVIILSIVDDPAIVARAMLAGARAYLVFGRFTPEELIRTIRAVQCSDEPIAPSLSTRALGFLKGDGPGHSPAAITPDSDLLTTREIEVLRLIVAGRVNREIAEALGVEEKTVKNHINSIYAKIHVDNREGALRYVLGQGQTGASPQSPGASAGTTR